MHALNILHKQTSNVLKIKKLNLILAVLLKRTLFINIG